MRISQILLSKPNLIIHPAIFPPLSLDADRPPQTASAGADTVSAGPKRPSMDEMPAICCVYTLRLFSRTLLTAFDALMIPPHRPSGLPVRCSHIYSVVGLALLSQLEFPAVLNFQPEHVSRRKSRRREFLRGFFFGGGGLWEKGDPPLSSRRPSVSLSSARGHIGRISASLEEQTSWFNFKCELAGQCDSRSSEEEWRLSTHQNNWIIYKKLADQDCWTGLFLKCTIHPQKTNQQKNKHPFCFLSPFEMRYKAGKWAANCCSFSLSHWSNLMLLRRQTAERHRLPRAKRREGKR